MDGQWAVVVGAGLGAGGAAVGALTGWVSTRLQTRTQLSVAQLQYAAQERAEAVTRRRAAYEDLVLRVDTVRRQMRIVRQRVREGADEDVLTADRAAVHDRIRDMQAAEWVLRLMLADEEQAAVSELTDAVYASHDALGEDVDAWLTTAEPGSPRGPGDAPRFGRTTAALQSQMMSFASGAHSRLYAHGPDGVGQMPSGR
ncbi:MULTISPECIES: hypothetical protein [unclassified Streptomyces]|uniref:hypothetical protein n=1 Tax=unclassified Streptomyces TaxID=2593676 RepID=UPI003677F070